VNITLNGILVWAGSLLAFGLYWPLVKGILRGEITNQSFATWILWVALDAIALVGLILRNGNYLLLVFYILGGSIVFLSLLYKKLFKWTGFETFVLILVVICLAIWYGSGSRWAIISSTIAVFVAGCPQIKDCWETPDKKTTLIYFGYTLANFLNFLGGKAWSIEERFYPGICTILCLLIALSSLRRKTVPSTRAILQVR